MAKKDKSVYVCASCGHQEAKWLGRCPACGQWNTLEEVTPRAQGAFASGGRAAAGASGSAGTAGGPAAAGARDAMANAVPLGDVPGGETLRLPTGIAELDRVLGGGAGLGASALIGGEPGIGKSTLMLQMAARASGAGTVLYVTGEEAAARLKGRAERLGLGVDGVHVLATADIHAVLGALERLAPAIVIIDSIQTLFSPEAGSTPGSVNQLKYCVFELADWARGHGSALFLVAHVTKEGAIAGPKVVEHMVDTVLMFEEAEGATRILRATKNRFGATDEIGLFRMGPEGLNEVPDPSALFLVRRDTALPPGTVVAPVYEGSRVLLVEIQALTSPAKGGVSRVFSDRIDKGRVSRVAAVLEKHAGLALAEQDLYVNVAGGIRIGEVGVELPLALALYSARTGISLPGGLAATGELSLAGEIRPVGALDRRLRAAGEHRFETVVSAARGAPGETVSAEWQGVDTIRAALKEVFGS